ncbi:MAG: hypothetical protein RDU59_12215 [Thermodesulfobacteriota bacterium]|nr:hypothetical protein [Thermodesulfobacteriota bacterium]
MGHANIISLIEGPIRSFVREQGATEGFTKDLGHSFLKLAVHNSQLNGYKSSDSQSFLSLSNIISSSGSFHSAELQLFFWAGSRLVPFQCFSKSDIAFLLKLEHLVGHIDFLPPLEVIRKRGKDDISLRHSKIEELYTAIDNAYASLYYIYEDALLDFNTIDESKWPSLELGQGVLDLLLKNDEKGIKLGSHFDAIVKVGVFLKPSFAAFLWRNNGLRRLLDIDPEELQEIIDSL